MSIQNISDETVDARYRRVMDWDIEPTAFSEYVTAVTNGSPLLLGNTDDGFETANPLGSRNDLGSTGDFEDSGPADHGALFDFGFGHLDSGQIKTFRIYYGAAGNEVEALAALNAVQAPIYSLGQPDVAGGPDLGIPNTFIFGFGDLGLTSGPITTQESFGAGNPAWAHSPQCNAGRPVNSATGNFWHTFSDLVVPGPGTPLLVARTYNALNADVTGAFGRGWSSNLDMRLEIGSDGVFTVHQENGAVAEFVESDGDFGPRPRLRATLERDGAGYRFVRHHRDTFSFDADGRLLAITDLLGTSTTFHYGANGLERVTDESGRNLMITTDSDGRIVDATGPLGRRVEYAYDSDARLIGVTDVEGGVAEFAYDDKHRMTDWWEAGGGLTSNVYDGLGRVAAQTDPTGAVTTFVYGDTTTTITMPDGSVQVHEYLDGVLTSITKGAGTAGEGTWNYAYDPDTLGRTSVVDPLGATETRSR